MNIPHCDCPCTCNEDHIPEGSCIACLGVCCDYEATRPATCRWEGCEDAVDSPNGWCTTHHEYICSAGFDPSEGA